MDNGDADSAISELNSKLHSLFFLTVKQAQTLPHKLHTLTICDMKMSVTSKKIPALEFFDEIWEAADHSSCSFESPLQFLLGRLPTDFFSIIITNMKLINF